MTNPTSSQDNDTPHLFVWRGAARFEGQGYAGDAYPRIPDLYSKHYAGCPFCAADYDDATPERLDALQTERDAASEYVPDPGTLETARRCRSCGFWYEEFGTCAPFNPTYDYKTFRFAALKNLEISDADLGLDELGTHLRRKFTDIYALSPRRFEELVADVFRELGYGVRLTPQTRDKGYDIVLLEHATGAQIIVECKRWAHRRTVGIAVVRDVLGAQLIAGVPRAKIVCTTRFSADAHAAADVEVTGYELELVDVEAFARALEIYNAKLPPTEFRRRMTDAG